MQRLWLDAAVLLSGVGPAQAAPPAELPKCVNCKRAIDESNKSSLPSYCKPCFACEARLSKHQGAASKEAFDPYKSCDFCLAPLSGDNKSFVMGVCFECYEDASKLEMIDVQLMEADKAGCICFLFYVFLSVWFTILSVKGFGCTAVIHSASPGAWWKEYWARRTIDILACNPCFAFERCSCASAWLASSWQGVRASMVCKSACFWRSDSWKQEKKTTRVYPRVEIIRSKWSETVSSQGGKPDFLFNLRGGSVRVSCATSVAVGGQEWERSFHPASSGLHAGDVGKRFLGIRSQPERLRPEEVGNVRLVAPTLERETWRIAQCEQSPGAASQSQDQQALLAAWL